MDPWGAMGPLGHVGPWEALVCPCALVDPWAQGISAISCDIPHLRVTAKMCGGLLCPHVPRVPGAPWGAQGSLGLPEESQVALVSSGELPRERQGTLEP